MTNWNNSKQLEIANRILQNPKEIFNLSSEEMVQFIQRGKQDMRKTVIMFAAMDARDLPLHLALLKKIEKRLMEAGVDPREPRTKKDIGRSEKVRVARAEQRIGHWLKDCTIPDPQSRESASKLYESYKNYSRDKGKVLITQTAFGLALRDLGFNKKTITGRIYRVGLRLKKEGEE